MSLGVLFKQQSQAQEHSPIIKFSLGDMWRAGRGLQGSPSGVRGSGNLGQKPERDTTPGLLWLSVLQPNRKSSAGDWDCPLSTMHSGRVQRLSRWMMHYHFMGFSFKSLVHETCVNQRLDVHWKTNRASLLRGLSNWDRISGIWVWTVKWPKTETDKPGECLTTFRTKLQQYLM